jgi:hypothetical protein
VVRPPANGITRIDMKFIPNIIIKHRPMAALVQDIFLAGRDDNRGQRVLISR